MVTRGSPKPLLRVRVLLPLPCVAADCAQFAATFLLHKSRHSSQRSVAAPPRIKAGFDAFYEVGRDNVRTERRKNDRGLRSVRGDVFAMQKPSQLTTLCCAFTRLDGRTEERKNGRTIADCTQFAATFLLCKNRYLSQRSVAAPLQIEAGFNLSCEAGRGTKGRGNGTLTALRSRRRYIVK